MALRPAARPFSMTSRYGSLTLLAAPADGAAGVPVSGGGDDSTAAAETVVTPSPLAGFASGGSSWFISVADGSSQMLRLFLLIDLPSRVGTGIATDDSSDNLRLMDETLGRILGEFLVVSTILSALIGILYMQASASKRHNAMLKSLRLALKTEIVIAGMHCAESLTTLYVRKDHLTEADFQELVIFKSNLSRAIFLTPSELTALNAFSRSLGKLRYTLSLPSEEAKRLQYARRQVISTQLSQSCRAAATFLKALPKSVLEPCPQIKWIEEAIPFGELFKEPFEDALEERSYLGERVLGCMYDG